MAKEAVGKHQVLIPRQFVQARVASIACHPPNILLELRSNVRDAILDHEHLRHFRIG